MTRHYEQQKLFRRLAQFLLLVVLLHTMSRTMAAAFSTKPNNSPNKIESAAIKRFTRFDKLCKTCPTLLQPKVSTLTEMIMGLPAEERDELLHTVTRRILQEEEQQQQDKSSASAAVQTPKDVFQFQTGVHPNTMHTKDIAQQKKKKETNHILITNKNNSKTATRTNKKDEPAQNNKKLLEKIEKVRSKFKKNKLKLTRTQCLLDQTNAILASSKNDGDATTTQQLLQVTTITDSDIYHCIDELQQMTRTELKMQRFKYVAQKAKCEQKLAKSRGKLYEANLALLEDTSRTKTKS
mmetsp:Transcript_3624/g.5304  ORF Transcript_3624/g.5304 Transcript_3624/m.5304 type:complete len:295 (+) Transcript_3624:70-954(+)